MYAELLKHRKLRQMCVCAISVAFKPQKQALANLNRKYIYWLFMGSSEKCKGK